eukprot:TRINITY_DN2365_c0_g2_i1.p1 TRINITY_DN2365_c0_g2~~TRINITY_DN2365_c0_g2_i1.p1  ORF type:complete len:244 (+),score=57.64 TRINITY_DN2365_c0_g2_i1:78-809(+)
MHSGGNFSENAMSKNHENAPAMKPLPLGSASGENATTGRPDATACWGVAETLERMFSDITNTGFVGCGQLGDITNVPLREKPMRSPKANVGAAPVKSPEKRGRQSLEAQDENAMPVPMQAAENQGTPQTAAPRVAKRSMFEKVAAIVRDSLNAQGMDSQWTSELTKRFLELGASEVDADADLVAVLEAHGWSQSRRQFMGPPNRQALLAAIVAATPAPPPPAWLQNVPTPFRAGRARPRRGGA